jgi:hypothetical protein
MANQGPTGFPSWAPPGGGGGLRVDWPTFWDSCDSADDPTGLMHDDESAAGTGHDRATMASDATPNHDHGLGRPGSMRAQAGAPFTRCVSGTISGVDRGSCRRAPSPISLYLWTPINRPPQPARQREPGTATASRRAVGVPRVGEPIRPRPPPAWGRRGGVRAAPSAGVRKGRPLGCPARRGPPPRGQARSIRPVGDASGRHTLPRYTPARDSGMACSERR